MLYISGCIASAWEPLHAESHISPSWAQSHFSCTRCLSYCDILPAVTPKHPSSTHFHPTTTPYKIPAKWEERQINLMVVERYRESEDKGEREREREKMSTHLSPVTMLMLSHWWEAMRGCDTRHIWFCIHMLTSFSVRKKPLTRVYMCIGCVCVCVCCGGLCLFVFMRFSLECWISISHWLW